MIVKELIALLEKMPQDMEVRAYASYDGDQMIETVRFLRYEWRGGISEYVLVEGE